MKKYISIIIIFFLLLIVFHKRYGGAPDPIINESSQMDIPLWTSDRDRQRIIRKGGDIDPDLMLNGRKEAAAFLQKQSKSTRKDGGIVDWHNLGPFNVGGRIRAIALQPNGTGGENIFIGAAAGGIWKSEDEGQTWLAINDFAPSLAVTSLAIDPNDPQILYAATGEGIVSSTMGIPGAGIFKSIDGGDTWSQLASTSTYYWVNKVAVNPHNSNHIMAVLSLDSRNGDPTFAGRLIESFNGGTTWITPMTDTNILTDIDFHPTDANVRTVSGHRKVFVYNALNGTYSNVVSGDTLSANDGIDNIGGRIEVAMDPSNSNIMYALQTNGTDSLSAQVYKSVNAGLTWSGPFEHPDVFRDGGLGNYANTIWVDPCNSNHVYLGGVDFWRSTDGGQTSTKISRWEDYNNFVNADIQDNIQLHADQHIIVPSLLYSCSNKKVYIGNDGGIQKTDNISSASDGLLTLSSGWSNLIKNNLCITQFYNIGVSSGDFQYGGGAQDNGIIIYTPNNIFNPGSWTVPKGGDGSMVLYHPMYPNVVFATNNYNKLYKSSNSGVSFTQTGFELGSNLSPLIGVMALNPTDTTEVYLAGSSLFKADLSANTWTELKPAISGSHFISTLLVEPDGRNFWVGYDNGVIQHGVMDLSGVIDWESDLTTPAMPNKCVTDIAINSNASKLEAVFSFAGYSTFNLWKYIDDNTSSITNISLDFPMQINTVTYHPGVRDWMYIGTDVGVFASENGGLDWSMTPLNDDYSSAQYNNEGPAFTEVSDLAWYYSDYVPGYALIAGTFGRGMWRSKDAVQFTGLVTDTIFIDFNYTGTPTLGTRTKPFATFTQTHIDAYGNTGTVIKFLSGGSNPLTGGIGNYLFDKRLTLIAESGSTILSIP